MKIFHPIMLATAFALGACSSTPSADIPASANPQDEITKLDQAINDAHSSNVDVLASSDFKESARWLKEAKEDAASNKKQETLLSDVRKGQGYLNKAKTIASGRSKSAESVLNARQAALKAGANKFPSVNSKLESVDNDVIDDAGKLDKLKPETLSKYQSRYMDLELAAIQETQLGTARAMVEGAKKDDADDHAPLALKKAEIDLKSAENTVVARRSDTQAFAPDVAKANESATFLDSVMKKIKANKGLKEGAASELVRQDQKIKGLSTDLATTQAQSADTQKQLSKTNEELKGATASVKIQQTIESARKEFSPAEAEVFQQGQNLVVRLKSMKFSSGRAELPAASIEVLAKVKTVAQGLDPKEVVVEGHTDSVGTAEINKNLSLERARIVAGYLSSNGMDKSKIDAIGYGFERPISSNKSKDGRAQNRRVDIIITPGTSDAPTASSL